MPTKTVLGLEMLAQNRPKCLCGTRSSRPRAQASTKVTAMEASGSSAPRASPGSASRWKECMMVYMRKGGRATQVTRRGSRMRVSAPNQPLAAST